MTVTVEEVTEVVIACLAEKKGADLDAIKDELAAAGPEFPYDSQWLVSAGATASRRLDVKLKHAKRNARAFRSVGALSRYIHELVIEREAA